MTTAITEAVVLPEGWSHEAAEANAPDVTGWGTGTRREFLHVDDLGEACVFALEQWQQGPDELQFLMWARAWT